jgi:hypothetical protein
MTEQEGAGDDYHGTKVTELLLLLPTTQFLVLEETAHQQNKSVGQLIRRAVSDFLKHTGSTIACSVQEIGESTR